MNSSNSRKMKKCRKKKCEEVWDEFVSALRNEKPLDVIDKIIEQNLLVLEQRFGTFGRTPLHHVCYHATDSSRYPLSPVCCYDPQARFDVIERLVERFPKALTMADKFGWLPLHNICCSEEVTLDLVRFLVKNFPDSVKAKTKRNETPLHLAIEVEVSLNLIQFLYQQYPGALLDQDNYGRTPLHLASYRCNDPEVLQTIYHHTAARMQMRNNLSSFHGAYRKRNIPLHGAHKNNNDTAIQFLLERDPVLLVELHVGNKIKRGNFARYQSVQNAAHALVGELVDKYKQSPKEMEPIVIAEHIAKLLETRPFPTLQQLDSLAPSITLKVNRDRIYRELEDMLYKRTFRELLKVHRFMIRINQSDYSREDPGNKAKYIAILAATAGGNDTNSDDNSDDDNSNNYESDDDDDNNRDADNNGDDDNNNNNRDDNKDDDNNNYSNINLLFQILRENTLLCNRLVSPLLFSNNKEQQEQRNPRRSKRLRKENQQEEEQQITKQSKCKSKANQQPEQQQVPRRSKRKRNENSTTAAAAKTK